MKVYTVQRQDKYDYDFSVLTINCGCFTSHEQAKQCAKRKYNDLCKECENEIAEFSNEAYYEEPADGLLEVEKDDEHGFYAISFGCEEDHESHIVWVDEWEVKE